MSSKLDKLFKALADPTRRTILKNLMLAGATLNVTTISAAFDTSRQAITKHILVLEKAGLVTSDRIGRETYYTAQPNALQAMNDWLAHYDSFWDNTLNNLGEHLDNNSKPVKKCQT